LNDLQVLVGLKMQHELVTAQAYTEGLILVASKIFGPGETKAATPKDVKPVGTVDAMMAFARSVNGRN
jgi:hypothetical protein